MYPSAGVPPGTIGWRVKLNSKLATSLLDNWGIAPIVQFYTGIPYSGTVTGTMPGGISGGGVNGSGGANRFPLLERNSFTGPNVWNVDLRLSRRFNIKEKMSLQDIETLMPQELINYKPVSAALNQKRVFRQDASRQYSGTRTSSRSSGIQVLPGSIRYASGRSPRSSTSR